MLLRRGHQVAAVARNIDRLATLASDLDHPTALLLLPGSVGNDTDAGNLRDAIGKAFGEIDAVVVSINSPRHPRSLRSHTTDELAAVIGSDLLSHYAAARAFVPALVAGGVFLGIGGGSADFVLEGGAQLSVAQAGLRMMYRGLAHEFAAQPIAVRQLIVASVVNGASTRDHADPLWVTAAEIGERVAAIVEAPGDYPEPIWRIGRRDGHGHPTFAAEAPTRVQGFR